MVSDGFHCAKRLGSNEEWVCNPWIRSYFVHIAEAQYEKDYFFRFFPSARFLGLSLKILFHKNKEIKRMLSKKMAFSLMSLITLLAFAFVVPSAMAAKITLRGHGYRCWGYRWCGHNQGDVSAADGIQAVLTWSDRV